MSPCGDIAAMSSNVDIATMSSYPAAADPAVALDATRWTAQLRRRAGRGVPSRAPPDSDGALAALARQHPGLDRHDPLSVLDAIGKDCPGAVQFCAPDDVEQVLDRPGRLVPVSPADVEQRLVELRLDDSASWTMRDEHWSLGGTQAKFALRRGGEAWFEAEGAQPSTHILKPGVRGLRSQSLVEHVSMRAAAECGVSVAHTERLEFKSESAVVVTRFDRRQDGSRLVRLHQEDLCQALGVSEKYEEHGGPSAHDVVELLRERSRKVVSRVRDLAERVPAAMLTALDEIDDWDGAVAELRARLEPALTEHLAGVVARLDTD